MTRPLVVASYNIHRGIGLDGALALGRIARVLRETRAEVIGLQEVLSRRGSNQAEVLARALGMEWVFGATRSFADGAAGNAVLSRFPIQRVGMFDLSRPGRQPRGGLRADLAVGRGRAVHLFNVHLGLGFRERRAQVLSLLLDGILRPADLSGPRVLLGDFNEWVPGRLVSYLACEFSMHRRHRRTHPALFPILALDRIYWDAELHGPQPRAHRSRLARIASDHLPVVARLRLTR